ncbi:hypothetical protein JCM19239_4708 [Vibrio variabilis]|uniref:Cell division protein FtsK n=1 Tax=Vibrio variabilis TaxID=990271 RepID=A0ABQ0JS86_9VIBR|nr:hypothetical protein JCM19239_4708 [Vibrio variabilis]
MRLVILLDELTKLIENMDIIAAVCCVRWLRISKPQYIDKY